MDVRRGRTAAQLRRLVATPTRDVATSRTCERRRRYSALALLPYFSALIFCSATNAAITYGAPVITQAWTQTSGKGTLNVVQAGMAAALPNGPVAAGVKLTKSQIQYTAGAPTPPALTDTATISVAFSRPVMWKGGEPVNPFAQMNGTTTVPAGNANIRLDVSVPTPGAVPSVNTGNLPIGNQPFGPLRAIAKPYNLPPGAGAGAISGTGTVTITTTAAQAGLTFTVNLPDSFDIALESDESSGDGPMPLWAIVTLGGGLIAIASRRLRRAA